MKLLMNSYLIFLVILFAVVSKLQKFQLIQVSFSQYGSSSPVSEDNYDDLDYSSLGARPRTSQPRRPSPPPRSSKPSPLPRTSKPSPLPRTSKPSPLPRTSKPSPLPRTSKPSPLPRTSNSPPSDEPLHTTVNKDRRKNKPQTHPEPLGEVEYIDLVFPPSSNGRPRPKPLEEVEYAAVKRGSSSSKSQTHPELSSDIIYADLMFSSASTSGSRTLPLETVEYSAIRRGSRNLGDRLYDSRRSSGSQRFPPFNNQQFFTVEDTEYVVIKGSGGQSSKSGRSEYDDEIYENLPRFDDSRFKSRFGQSSGLNRNDNVRASMIKGRDHSSFADLTRAGSEDERPPLPRKSKSEANLTSSNKKRRNPFTKLFGRIRRFFKK